MGSTSPQPVPPTEEAQQQPIAESDKTVLVKEVNSFLATAQDEPFTIELEVSGRKAKKMHPSTGVVVSITTSLH